MVVPVIENFVEEFQTAERQICCVAAGDAVGDRAGRTMRLIAEKLSGGRGGETLFSGCRFRPRPGEALIVTGPNGSGKSTLLRDDRRAAAARGGGQLRLEGGGEEWPSVAAACHYLGHLNAMKTGADGRRESRILAALSRRAAALTVEAALDKVGLGGIGHLPFGYLSTGQKRRAAIARLLVSHRPIWLLDEPTAGLDARIGGGVRGADERASRRWRDRGGGDAPAAGDRRGQGAGVGDGGECDSSPTDVHGSADRMTALFFRDLRLGIRAGGGALTGVLFFLAVIATIPFAVGPDLNLLARIGPAILWIGALLASLLGLDRLFQADREDGSLDLMILGRPPHAGADRVRQMPGALDGERAAAGRRRAVARPVHEHRARGHRRGDADAAGRHAGHHLHRRGRCGGRGALPRGGLMVSVLVLPLAIPVLIFGVSASYAAVAEPDPFLPPFLILCALSMLFAVVGPVAAAIALRWGSD